MTKSPSVFEKVWVTFLSWLIPGFGFFYNGRFARGLLFFVFLEGTFLVGAAFHGSVLLPDFRFGSEGFNVVTILTFFTQMFNGALALLSLAPELLHGIHVLPYDETNQWADLGGFFLLVSGGMNYFVMASAYDHFYGRKRRGPIATSLGAQ